MKKYGTIKRGKVKFKLGSKQHKYLEVHNLPYSIVTITKKGKSIRRKNT